MVPTNATVLRSRFRSQRIAQFTESVIREMTRLAVRHGAINLAQGFPDFPAHAELKNAAVQAIDADINQYAITWGAKPFRDAIAAKYQRTYGMEFDPEREITVCCGATEGIIASLLAVLDPGDEVRSILVNSMSKTYSVTGWRVGWVLASPDLTGSIRKIHDFLTVGAAAPLQQAGVHALGLGLPERYYTQLSQEYAERRDHLLTSLQGAGFKSFMPHGAYYFMTDISSFGFADDASFVCHLITHVGVAAVPGSSFFPM